MSTGPVRRRRVVVSLVLAACALSAAGCTHHAARASTPVAWPSGSPSVNQAVASDSPTPEASTPAAVPSSAPPKPIPSPSRQPAPPAHTSTHAPIVPSKKPTQVALPPPPPPVSGPTTGPNCPSYTGPVSDKATVRAALDAAAAKHFWVNSAPTISVPTALMHAFAWQESGWQDTIRACDGGIGTMQVMPATATWMNNRFGTAYPVGTLAGNTMLGGEYIEWLVKYFGDVYYAGSYDLSVPAAAGGVSLLDSIVSAYNYGVAAVDPTKGRAGVPNWRYVNNVEALMASCPCDG